MSKAETRRRQVVSAAALLFRRRGYHAVGIDDIGAAVGMTGPALYRHFTGKPAVLHAVIRSFVEDLYTERQVRNQDGEERVLEAAIAVGMRQPDQFVTTHRDLDALKPAARAELDVFRTPVAEGWRDLLASRNSVPGAHTKRLRLTATSGVLLHLSLTGAGNQGLRAALARELSLKVLDAPLPDVTSTPDPVWSGPIRHVTTREALLQAAILLFQQQGYARVSLRDIGEAVGLSASAVSRHFQSKDQLMAVIFDRANAQIAGAIAVALRTSSSGEAAARAVLQRYVSIAFDQRDLILTTSTQASSLTEPRRQSRIRSRRMFVDELAHVLGLARPGLTAAECRLRAGAAYSAVNEVVMDPSLWLRDGAADALTTLSHAVLLGGSAG